MLPPFRLDDFRDEHGWRGVEAKEGSEGEGKINASVVVKKRSITAKRSGGTIAM